jgi:hypothetical protein
VPVGEYEGPRRPVDPVLEALVALLEQRRPQAGSGEGIGGERQTAEPRATWVRSVADQVSAVMAREFSTTVLADPTWIAGDAHRVAQIVETIEGVTGVFPVLFERGRTYRIPYHFQLAVFVRPGGRSLEEIEKKIDERLDELRVSANWEHWGLRPKATLEVDGVPQSMLGSLIVPVHEASRAPEVPGVLPPPAPIVRVVTVLSSDYGGSKPIGGWLATASGAGLMEGEEAARPRQSPTFRRRAIPGDDARRREMGWVNERLLHLLCEPGSAPGGWCLTTETRYLAGYEPLERAFATTPEVLVTLHQGPEWQNMASWRLAKAQWDDDRREEARRDGDGAQVLDAPQDGAEVTPRQRAAMENIADRARAVRSELADWEERLERLVAEREAHDRPTVAITFDRLPEQFRWALVRGGRWVLRRGSGAPAVNVNYLDEVDLLLDTWTEAAAEALAGLATLAGFEHAVRDEYYEHIPSAPVRRALRSPEGARRSTRAFGALHHA